MNRKRIVVGLIGALVLAVIVFVANWRGEKESRAASKALIVTQDGAIKLVPVKGVDYVTFVANYPLAASNKTVGPKNP